MPSVHRMPRPGLLKHCKRKSSINRLKCSHSLRSNIACGSKTDEETSAKVKKNATFFSIDNEMSDFDVFSDSKSLKEALSNWKKSRSSASPKRIDHTNTDKSSDEDKTIWTDSSSMDSRKMSDNETTTTTKKEAASNTSKSFLQRYHKKHSFKRQSSSFKELNKHCITTHGSTNSNVTHLQCQSGNAGDTKVMSVETITAEMERLKDMAQMMSEMNKRLSGENEAMMELMRSVQPRAKELMNQLEQERKEAHELKASSKRSFKDHEIMKSELNKLRIDLFSEKEKFNRLKSQVVHLRSQYILKVNKLQQLKRNTKKLIERYREFKEEHSVCGEEREMLRTKLVEVVSKFDKLKSIASQFQEGGSISTKLRELQNEKSILQDEKARLEMRLREYEGLEKRMEKVEVEAKTMASEYESDLERMRGLLENKEQLLIKLEKDQISMRQENDRLSKNVERLTEEHEEIKELLESKDVELDDTRGRLTLQDENIRKLQDAYLQMTLKLSESQTISNEASRKYFKNNVTNTGTCTERPMISKDVMGRFESVINDITDRTYSLRKSSSVGEEEEVEEDMKCRNNNLAVGRKEVWKNTEDRRTTRKVLRAPPVYESKSSTSTLKKLVKDPRHTSSVMKQFDEETQTENSRAVEPPICTAARSAEPSKHRFRTVSRPISGKEKSYFKPMIPRSVTKNNNSCFRYAHGRQRIWRLCRSHDPVFQNMVPSRCAIVGKKDSVRFKSDPDLTTDGSAIYGKLDKVFEAIRAQEDGIERLKSQLDLICETSQIDDDFSDDEVDEEN